MNLSSLPSAVVDDPIHPDRAGLGGASWVDLDCWLGRLFSIAQFGVPDFVRNQERLVEGRSNVLVNDEGNLTVESCTRAIEDRSARGTLLHAYPERGCDPKRELIGRPGIVPTFDCLVVQPFGMLSSELYSIHGQSLLSSFDRVSSVTPASLRTLSNGTFSAATGLVLDLLTRS